MSIRTRLRRLEALARRRASSPAPPCEACRARHGRVVMVDVGRRPDGTVVRGPDYPQPCGVCGRIPEQLIEVMHLIGSEESLAAPGTEAAEIGVPAAVSANQPCQGEIDARDDVEYRRPPAAPEQSPGQ